METDFKKKRLMKIARKLEQLEKEISSSSCQRELQNLNFKNNYNTLNKSSNAHTQNNSEQFFSHKNSMNTNDSFFKALYDKHVQLEETNLNRVSYKSKLKKKNSYSRETKRDQGDSNVFEQFHQRKKNLDDLKIKKQKKYEQNLKKKAEKLKISLNSKILLEKIKLNKMKKIINMSFVKLDFQNLGWILFQLNMFEYLKFEENQSNLK